MSWQPDQAGVQQIVSLLTEFQQPGADQHKILVQLDQCRAIPDFNNYLAFIFANGDGLPVEVRQGAGLLLKNNLRAAFASVPQQLRESIKESLLRALSLSDRALRHTAGTCAVTIVGLEGAGAWPQLINALAQALDSQDPSAVEGALDTVYKLWEEQPQALERELPPGSRQRPSAVLVPRILHQFGSPDPASRALAVSATNISAGFMPSALVDAMDTYVQGLFSLATDASPAVRKAVCTGLVQLLSLSAGSLEANLHSVIEYMLASTQDPDEGVAVEACEFWSEYPESGLDLDALKPFLPRILLVLLGNMVWDEYDEEVAEAEAAEEEGLSGGTPERDRDSDVKPAHVGGLHAAGGAMGGEGYEEGDEDDEDDGGGVWNLRRCSAAGLDVLASSFGNEVLPLLLPTVQARLAEPDWRTRESGILALGAVSEGCGGELAAHLPGIVAALLPAMRDPRPLVRCIACWTLTRYGRWLVDRATQGQRAEVDALVEGLCERVGDHNRKVQEAACSSVAAFAEESGDAVMPYAGQVLTALAGAVQRYGRRTLRNAYDAIATLAENCPAAVASPQAAALVLQPMFGRLAALRSGDRDVLPLLECFAAVAPAVAAHMEPYAVDLFSRCMGLVDSMRAGAASGAIDKEEADEFTVGALDAISGLAEGLGAGIEPLIGRSALVEVLVSCAGDPSADVRQSAFALIGDLARACGPHLRPVMNELVAAALTSLQPVNITQATMSVCNNAAWALGEMAVAGLPEQAAQYALPVLQCLLQILSVPAGGLPRGLVENAAIALGRFAWVAADALAPNGAAFMGPLCSALRGVRDGTEKEHAFLGLCSVLRLNPDCGAGAFTPLCEAVVSWRSLPCDGLSNELSHIMRAYKEQLVGMGQWEEAMAALSPAASQKLIETCHLG